MNLNNMFKKKKIESGGDLLLAIPERVVDWKYKEDLGIAVLLVPRFRGKFSEKWLQPRLKRPYMKIELDEIGTFVWGRCDGKNTVHDILTMLKGHFGEKIEPAEDRLKLFLSMMFNSKFIRYWQRLNETPGL